MAAAEVKPTVKGLNRTEALASIMQDPVWDVVVVGGGATGAGVALDAASRGLKTLLLEAQDFSAGTSSRSTKLIHGGVRYLKNPRDWGLVHDALVERKRLIDNCPQLVHAEPFVLPCFKKWEREIYMAGLGFYGAMAGKDQIGRTRMLKPEEAEKVLPGVKTEGLLGGVEFFDAQFDDARLNIALIRTAATHGAVCLNYMPVVGLERIGGLIQSVTVEDKHTGESHRIRTKMVFNCAGVWADQIRRLADPQAAQLLRFSRGTHVVVDRSFLPGDAGMLIPKRGMAACCLLFLGITQYFSAPQMLRSVRRSSIRSRQKTRLPLFSRRLPGIWQSLFIAATCLLLSLVCVRFCGCRQVNPQPLRLREAIPLFRNSAI